MCIPTKSSTTVICGMICGFLIHSLIKDPVGLIIQHCSNNTELDRWRQRVLA